MAAEIDVDRETKRAIGEDPESFEYEETKVLIHCAQAHVEFDRRVIHRYGLTDPFLARMTVDERRGDRPAHSLALIERAPEVAHIHQRGEVGRGMMRAAVDADDAAAWVENNLEAIETIERKAFNDHDLAENLALAFGSQERIQVAN
jgi:hypothetical protein